MRTVISDPVTNLVTTYFTKGMFTAKAYKDDVNHNFQYIEVTEKDRDYGTSWNTSYDDQFRCPHRLTDYKISRIMTRLQFVIQDELGLQALLILDNVLLVIHTV